MQNKRGQITIFIILGILIVFTLAFIFFITRITVEKKEVLTRPVVEVVPTELNPILLFTEECLRRVAIDGLVLAGQQGGYVYPREYGFKYSTETTDSDGIMFSERFVIPYWLYNHLPNGVKAIDLVSLKPPLKRGDGANAIERQLDRYVNENLKTCLGDYEIFAEQGYAVKEKEDVDTTATILPGHVTFYIKYPLGVSRGDVESKISNFFADIPVDLHGMYAVAENITALEQEYSFLEKGTLNWITAFTAIDKDKLPPMTDIDFKIAGGTFWMTRDVEKNLKSMLSTYVPMFRVTPSRNFYRYEYPTDIEYHDVVQRIYDDTIINIERPNIFDIRFDYLPLWPIYLFVDDDAGIIKPDSVSTSFPMLMIGVQNYRTVYDVSYPVMVSLYDSEALNKKGFGFNFALEANIRNNEPVEDDEVLAPTIAFFEESLACNENQRNSIDYTIRIEDSYDGTAVAEANIFYSPAPGEDCFIGITGDDGILATRFPVGYGGTLKVVKDDYLTTSILLDPKSSVGELRSGEKTDIVIKLNKFHVVTVSANKKKVFKVMKEAETNWIIPVIKKSPFWFVGAGALGIPLEERVNVKWIFNPAAWPLQNNEMAVITLTRISDLDQPFSMAATVTGNMSQDIMLVPGVYEVNIQLILDERVVIPKEERCYSKPGLLPAGILPKDIGWEVLEQEYCVTIEEIAFDEFPNGGVEFIDAFRWHLRVDAFYPSNEVVFYAVSPAITDIPEVPGVRVVEDLEQMGKIKEYSVLYRTALEPDYK